jgi:hypothetical protein
MRRMTETLLHELARPSSPTDGLDTHVGELVQLVQGFTPTDGLHETAIAPLQLVRASEPGQPLPAVYEPGLALVVQGRKHARLGAELVVYDPLHYLLISVTMLPVGQVVEASPERPYLCIRLQIDPRDIASLLTEGIPALPRPPDIPGPGLGAVRVSAELLDAVARLLRLLHTPQHAAVLAPLALREIHYRVLTGELGPRLAAMAAGCGQARRIAAAIDLIKRRSPCVSRNWQRPFT